MTRTDEYGSRHFTLHWDQNRKQLQWGTRGRLHLEQNADGLVVWVPARHCVTRAWRWRRMSSVEEHSVVLWCPLLPAAPQSPHPPAHRTARRASAPALYEPLRDGARQRTKPCVASLAPPVGSPHSYAQAGVASTWTQEQWANWRGKSCDRSMGRKAPSSCGGRGSYGHAALDGRGSLGGNDSLVRSYQRSYGQRHHRGDQQQGSRSYRQTRGYGGRGRRWYDEQLSCGLMASEAMDLMFRDITPEDYDTLLRLDETLEPRPSSVVSKAFVEALPAVPPESLSGETCAVCLGNLDSEEAIVSLPCSHNFHRGCIARWLSKCRRTCPVCGLEATDVVDSSGAQGAAVALTELSSATANYGSGPLLSVSV